MNNLTEYFLEMLGIEINPIPLLQNDLEKLPLFLRKKYNYQIVMLYNRQLLFVKIENQQGVTTEQLRKHAVILEETLNKPVVFIFEFIESYNRKRLIQKKIAFIVPGKQIYLPFMFVHLNEIKTAPTGKTEKLLPAAQCLLFYHLYKENIAEYNFKLIAQKLNYGQMTITRVATQLKALNLCEITGSKEKIFLFNKNKKELWNNIQPFLITPVEKIVYTDKINFDALLTNVAALAYYTNIADTGKTFIALYKNDFNTLRKQNKITLTNNYEGECGIEVWKYNPISLDNGKYVDPLSLISSFRDNQDECITSELNILNESLW
jgi:hypothetical protein